VISRFLKPLLSQLGQLVPLYTSGGPSALMSAAEKTEEEDAYLMGEKKYEAPAEENEFAKAAAGPGALLADGPAARNETWNKLNSDPLLMMRMQEQEARKQVMQHPVKMAQIQKEVAELRVKKKAKKEAKKEAEKEKKEDRKRVIREEVRRKVLGEEGYAAAKRREGAKPKSGPGRGGRSDDSSASGSPINRGSPHSRSRSRSPPRRAGGRGDGRDERGGEDRYRQGGGGGGGGGDRRERDDHAARRRDDHGGGGRRRSRSRSRDRGDRRDQDRGGSGRGRDDDRRDRRDDSRGGERGDRRDDAHRRDDRRHDDDNKAPAAPSSDKDAGAPAPAGGDRGGGHRDGASAQDGSKGYGLTFANQRAQDAAATRVERRNEWRENTKDERDAADEVAKKAKEAAWSKNGGKNSVGHRTGKLTAEEKAARLRSMMSDADVHDEARWSRIQTNAAEEAAAGEKSLVELSVGAPARHHSEVAPFLEAAQRKAFGGGEVGEGGGLEDRIAASKYYAQRGGDGNSFKR
jgi:hypothetical protein